MLEQLDFFAETQEEKLIKEMEDLRLSMDKLRKSWFAQLSEVKKQNFEYIHELETLKSALCRCKENDFANYPLFADIKQE